MEQYLISLIQRKIVEFWEICGSRQGTKAARAKARLVILVELGTHLITDALISPDRLITDLMAYKMFPSLMLADEYHWRWEVENTLSEFKTHLNSRKTPIRSKKPKLVVPEIYGWLLAHWAVRSLIFRASTTTDKSPRRFSFTGTLRILRRAISQFQPALPSSLPYFFSWLISEIAEQIIPTRQGRTNPRVVKKPCSKFRARKRFSALGGSVAAKALLDLKRLNQEANS